jgi:hypothetical protein
MYQPRGTRARDWLAPEFRPAERKSFSRTTRQPRRGYNVDGRAVLYDHIAPEQAILQVVRSSNANVDPIAGEKLDFGGVAHAVLTR